MGFGTSGLALAGVLVALWTPPDSIALSAASKVTTFGPGATSARLRGCWLPNPLALLPGVFDGIGVGLGTNWGQPRLLRGSLAHCSRVLRPLPAHFGLELCSQRSGADCTNFFSSAEQHRTAWDLAQTGRWPRPSCRNEFRNHPRQPNQVQTSVLRNSIAMKDKRSPPGRLPAALAATGSSAGAQGLSPLRIFSRGFYVILF